VTQAECERVIGTNPNNFKSVKGRDTSRFPVENVSYEDAVEFCRQLSELHEEKRAGRLCRLPTEAEWEYSCRGGASDSKPFYFEKPSAVLSAVQANFDGDYPYGGAPKGQYLQRPTPVGSYKPSPFGLYDMHGNIWSGAPTRQLLRLPCRLLPRREDCVTACLHQFSLLKNARGAAAVPGGMGARVADAARGRTRGGASAGLVTVMERVRPQPPFQVFVWRPVVVVLVVVISGVVLVGGDPEHVGDALAQQPVAPLSIAAGGAPGEKNGRNSDGRKCGQHGSNPGREDVVRKLNKNATATRDESGGGFAH
jgi:hypothetical protein